MRPISFADVPSLGLNLKDEGREKEGRRGKKRQKKIFSLLLLLLHRHIQI